VQRRTFLAAAVAAAAPGEFPIIDTHIHLFDTMRPEGVPWPAKEDAALYRPALPERYRGIAAPLGITGAIEVECSPLVEDNQWVLDTIAGAPIVLGTVGNLDPGASDFGRLLERFHRNPRFLGIRYGDLWGRDFAREAERAEFVAGLKLLAEANLALDTANPSPALLETVVRITDRVPNLRVVIDHLPQVDPGRVLGEFAKRKQVYCKLSEILRRVNGRVPEDIAYYRDRLEQIYGTFGEDRVLYGSDWPNSDHWAPYATVLSVARAYFALKTRAQAEKYFWKNSQAAYRWAKAG
jgi:predicted TIM-barrel fold metal-dependent hydrolase